jgi:acyl-CoA thioester hydrolase
MDEVLAIGIRCEWVGEKSFAFAYEIRTEADDRLIVQATSIQVCYDYQTKRSIPMPADLRRAVEAFEGRPLARAAGVGKSAE